MAIHPINMWKYFLFYASVQAALISSISAQMTYFIAVGLRVSLVVLIMVKAERS